MFSNFNLVFVDYSRGFVRVRFSQVRFSQAVHDVVAATATSDCCCDDDDDGDGKPGCECNASRWFECIFNHFFECEFRFFLDIFFNQNGCVEMKDGIVLFGDLVSCWFRQGKKRCVNGQVLQFQSLLNVGSFKCTAIWQCDEA